MPRPEIPYEVGGRRQYHIVYDPARMSFVEHELFKLRAPAEGADPIVCKRCETLISEHGERARMDWGAMSPIDVTRTLLVAGPKRPPKVPDLYFPPVRPEELWKIKDEDLTAGPELPGHPTRFTRARMRLIAMVEVHLGRYEVPPDIQNDVLLKMHRVAASVGTRVLRWEQASEDFDAYLASINKTRFRMLRQRPKKPWYQTLPPWVGEKFRKLIDELTPEELKQINGELADIPIKGANPSDVAVVQAWLDMHGLTWADAVRLFVIGIYDPEDGRSTKDEGTENNSGG